MNGQQTTLDVAKQQDGKCGERFFGMGWFVFSDGSLSNYTKLEHNYYEERDPEEIGKIDEMKLQDAVTNGWTEEDYDNDDHFDDYYNVLEAWVDEAKKDWQDEKEEKEKKERNAEIGL